MPVDSLLNCPRSLKTSPTRDGYRHSKLRKLPRTPGQSQAVRQHLPEALPRTRLPLQSADYSSCRLPLHHRQGRRPLTPPCPGPRLPPHQVTAARRRWTPPRPPSSLALSPVDISSDGGYDLASLLSTCYADGAGLEGALDSIFDGFIRTDGLNGLSGADTCLMGHDNSHIDGHCGCLSDTGSYNVVLELSLRLRRAAETLNRFPKHRTPSSCPIHQRISDLDRCATYVVDQLCCVDSLLIMLCREVLGSVNTSDATLSSYGGVVVPSGAAFTLQGQMPSRSQTLGGTISPQSLHNDPRPQWEYKAPSYPTPPSEDSFMSWEPHRRSTDWSP